MSPEPTPQQIAAELRRESGWQRVSGEYLHPTSVQKLLNDAADALEFLLEQHLSDGHVRIDGQVYACDGGWDQLRTGEFRGYFSAVRSSDDTETEA